MSRFNDILRAPQLQAQFQEYMQWLALPPDQRRTRYRTVRGTAINARHERVPGWIRPFNKVTAGLYYDCRLLKQTQTSGGPGQGPAGDDNCAQRAVALTTGSQNLVEYTLPTGAGVTIVKIPNYKFAKVIVKDRVAPATTDSTSRMTGRLYKKHTTLAASQPFGRGDTEPNTFGEALAQIKGLAVYTEWVSTEGDTISIVPERST